MHKNILSYLAFALKETLGQARHSTTMNHNVPQWYHYKNKELHVYKKLMSKYMINSFYRIISYYFMIFINILIFNGMHELIIYTSLHYIARTLINKIHQRNWMGLRDKVEVSSFFEHQIVCRSAYQSVRVQCLVINIICILYLHALS